MEGVRRLVVDVQKKAPVTKKLPQVSKPASFEEVQMRPEHVVGPFKEHEIDELIF